MSYDEINRAFRELAHERVNRDINDKIDILGKKLDEVIDLLKGGKCLECESHEKKPNTTKEKELSEKATKKENHF